MKRSLIACALLGLATAASADPFAAGNPKIGKQMMDKNCTSCHVSSFGGDGSAIYTREDRIVENASGLLARIRTCETNLGLKWFEDEELHVAAYLNQTYYHFK
ncbi:MAG TPA: cytochrome c [Novimethylophilus sp.]|jgi:mono/diheme cytochrome c family protein|uniref:cytochrome c n=1 Tax=Novimethylophilus sp. TaxID=2137426 RepID=UPI002F3F8495